MGVPSILRRSPREPAKSRYSANPGGENNMAKRKSEEPPSVFDHAILAEIAEMLKEEENESYHLGALEHLLELKAELRDFRSYIEDASEQDQKIVGTAGERDMWGEPVRRR